MPKCLKTAWKRKRFSRELARAESIKNTKWTAVGVITSGIDRATRGLESSKPQNNEEDPMVVKMQSYLQLLCKHSIQTGGTSTHNDSLDQIEGSLKLAQSVVFPRRSNKPLPEWYRELREKAEKEDSHITEASAIKTVSILGSVYGLSIIGQSTEGSTDVISAAEVPDDLKHESDFLGSDESQGMELAFVGKWESEVLMDPEVVDTALLATKLKALQVPTLPPQLGGNVPLSGIQGKLRSTTRESQEWKPRVNSMIASSSAMGGHMAAVVRLAVSLDSSFFVSASHDGTCAVWEVPQLDQCTGFLERKTAYMGHAANGPTRVNDVAMIEGTTSVVSGASNGSIHSWRVDMVPSSTKSSLTSIERRERSRVVGTSSIREVDPSEGEILAVSHFSSVSNSVVVYATQKGIVRTWDLRSSTEPFALAHGPKLGHLSAMALGVDRNWIVTGTNRGFVVLWDIRFQQPFKLWRHSRGEKVNRLAASFVPPPQTWGGPNAAISSRPFIFVGSPSNECSMFDVVDGSCVECFRAINGDLDALRAGENLPSLVDVTGRSHLRYGVLSVRDDGFEVPRKSFLPSINCMVGSIGGHSNSFLLTGGSDGCLRFWDFFSPNRCYSISGALNSQPRPTFERIDFDASRRLMLCRQHATSRTISQGSRGLKKPECYYHTDAIEDIKIVDKSALISCSRDRTVKVWR